MTETSMGVGFIAVFAVSGSIALLVHQLHKRLFSDFMKKIEYELAGSVKDDGEKKVRFADDVREPSSNNKEYRRRPSMKRQTRDYHNKCSSMDDTDHVQKRALGCVAEGPMAANRQVLYKGLTEYKSQMGQNV